jgi:hypothetical protein
MLDCSSRTTKGMCAGLLLQSLGIRVQGQPQELRKWHMRNLAALRLSWTSKNALFDVVAPWDCLRLCSSTMAVLSHGFCCRSPLACRAPRPLLSLPNPPAPCPLVYSAQCPPPIQAVEHIHPKPKTHLKLPHRSIEASRGDLPKKWQAGKLLANGGYGQGEGTLGARAGGVQAMAHGGHMIGAEETVDAKLFGGETRRRNWDLWGAWHGPRNEHRRCGECL